MCIYIVTTCIKEDRGTVETGIVEPETEPQQETEPKVGLRAAPSFRVLDLRLRNGCGSYIDKISPLPIVSSS